MDLDIKVGDRVTYKDSGRNEICAQIIVYTGMGKDFKNNKYYEIIKIERIGENGWYTVYEKKELLTDEEREFLKDIIKYYDNISQIVFNNDDFNLCDNSEYIVCALDYSGKLKFENIKRHKLYTLKDLGLEEEVCE